MPRAVTISIWPGSRSNAIPELGRAGGAAVMTAVQVLSSWMRSAPGSQPGGGAVVRLKSNSPAT